MTVDLSLSQLTKVRPDRVRDYLAATGWELVETLSRATVWSRKNEATGDEFEVLLPSDDTPRDYLARLRELFETIAACERRPASEIAQDVIAEVADKLSIRIDHPGGDGTALSLNAGADAFRGARDMFAAAAASEVEPRPFYPNPKVYTPVRTLLRAATFGQTQKGSYVITVQVPLQPYIPTLFDRPEEPHVPFERRVLLRLTNALDALRQAAQIGDGTGFLGLVPIGVSANLCAAVERLGRARRLRTVELNLDWSWRQPADAKSIRRIPFDRDQLKAIRTGGQRLKAATRVENFVLAGHVVSLRRGAAQAEGTVTVRTIIEGQPRDVTLLLTGAEHQEAIKAYDTQLPVACVGELDGVGTTLHLTAPRNFKITDPRNP